MDIVWAKIPQNDRIFGHAGMSAFICTQILYIFVFFFTLGIFLFFSKTAKFP